MSLMGYVEADVMDMLDAVETASLIIKENKECNTGLLLTAEFLEGLLIEGRV
jgi:hypothetical protein